jgi:hypothetical protein
MALHIKRGAGEPSELLAISEIYFDLTNKDFYVGDEVANYRVNDAVMLRWLNNQAIQAKNFAGSFVDVFKVNTSNQLENLLKTKLTGGLKSPFTQVVIVDSGGLGDYTSIQDASDTITDADPVTKPYTILVVSPGGYDPAGYTLKNGVNVIALDPKNTKILGQVTDNGVAVHCYLKINTDNRQADGSSGLNLDAASVVNIVGNVTGGYAPDGDGGYGIFNGGAGTVTVNNGNVTGGEGGDEVASGFLGGHGIYNGSTGTVTVNNGNVTGGFADNGGYGIFNGGAGTVTVTGGNVTGSGGVSNAGHGIYNGGAGTVTVNNSNIIGGAGSSEGSGIGILNASTGMVRVKNGTISNFGTTATSYPIFIYGNNSLILENCKIIGVHVDVPAIYADSAKNVKLMNVWSNRDLHSNITNLISGGFTYDSDVPSS